MRFIFQESFIWDGVYTRPDTDRPVKVIKLPKDDEARARRKLPKPELGRRWILLRKEE